MGEWKKSAIWQDCRSRAVGMRILFTGSGGRLGRLLFAARGGSGLDPDALVFQSRAPGRDLQWAPGDALSRLPACDVVVGLWGVTAGDAAALEDNTKLAQLSLAVARACGAALVFHLSSAAVYGPGAQLAEDRRPRPANAYGASKHAMETAMLSGPRAAGDPRQVALRLANVVGADSLAPALGAPGAATLDRFADGRGPVRSYIGAADLLQALWGLSQPKVKDMPDIINIAAPAPVAMEDLLRAAGKPVAWRPAPPGAVQDVSLDTARLHALLPGFRPAATAPDMIAQLRRLEAAA